MDWKIGDIVKIHDEIDPSCSIVGTVRYIEQDTDMPGLFWLYIVSNCEELNINIHPLFGPYWRIIDSHNDLIEFLSDPSN